MFAIALFNLLFPFSSYSCKRSNTAHQRFWEARTLWGQLINVSRNLTRDLCVVVKVKSLKNRKEKENILLLIAAFAFAIKLHLRAEPVNDKIASLMYSSQYFQLKYRTNHPPLKIAFWISNYLQSQHEHYYLNIYQLSDLHRLVDTMVDILGGCERILKTPQPIIYTLMLRNLVVAYCLILPLEIVNDCGEFTGVIMIFTSMILFGIEQIGSQLEQSFAQSPNTLPLDSICNTILFNVTELIESMEHIQKLDTKLR